MHDAFAGMPLASPQSDEDRSLWAQGVACALRSDAATRTHKDVYQARRGAIVTYTMKLLILADIDDFHWKHGAGEADVLLSCGDVCDQVILEAGHAYRCALILAVKGNHDSNAPFAEPIEDAHINIREFKGLSFGGLNGSWRYKPRGHFLYDQEDVEDLLRGFPRVDVFFSHNSPRRIHDQEDEVHFGFEALNTYIQRAEPGLVIHGHQHTNSESKLDETRIVGVFGHRLMEI